MTHPSGVCRFCKLTAEQLDRKDRAFLDRNATRCNAPACVKAFDEEYDRRLRQNHEREGLIRRVREGLRKARRRGRRATA